jgi:hypothetical protein
MKGLEDGGELVRGCGDRVVNKSILERVCILLGMAGRKIIGWEIGLITDGPDISGITVEGGGDAGRTGSVFPPVWPTQAVSPTGAAVLQSER